MEPSWTSLGEWWLRSALGGGLLLLLAWGLMACLRQPARRQRLGEGSMAAALLLVPLCLVPCWLIVSMPLPVELPESASAAVEQPVAEAPRARAVPPSDRQGADEDGVEDEQADEHVAVPGLPTDGGGADADNDQLAPVAVASVAAPARLSWGELGQRALFWLGAVYGLGAALLLGRLALGYVGLWRLVRRSEPAPAAVVVLIAELAGGVAPRVLLSRRLRVPLSFGLWRPTIVLPWVLGQCGDLDLLRWVCRHELTHLQRRDPWSCLLFGLGQTVFWFLPWFWWLRRQVRLCQEYVADAAAVAGDRQPEDYAQFLLNLCHVPAAPAAAVSIRGHTSDLFRRITMLLKSPRALDKRCPRSWCLAVACGLLGLAVVLSGIGLRAAAAQDPAGGQDVPAKKDAPAQKDEQKKPGGLPGLPDFPFPDLDKILPPGGDQELRKELERMQQEMRKLFEQLQQNFPQLPNNLPQIQGGGITISRPGDNRLGGRLTKPNDTLAEQLNLPRGKGLVLDNVKDNSAASKAGLKNHDILLEVGGQAVPSNINEFNKILDGIKAKTPVDVVVLRKGKNETIKGLELPEAQKGIIGGLKVQPIKLKPLKVQPLPAGKVLPVIPGGVTRGMSITRNNDEFTARYTEGNVTITVIGKIEGGKTTVSNVEVKDGDKTNNYKSVEAVPESFRADVRELIRQVERGGVRVPGKD